MRSMIVRARTVHSVRFRRSKIIIVGVPMHSVDEIVRKLIVLDLSKITARNRFLLQRFFIV